MIIELTIKKAEKIASLLHHVQARERLKEEDYEQAEIYSKLISKEIKKAKEAWKRKPKNAKGQYISEES